jgi:uncharacterized protein (DUF427 family)
LKHFAGPSFWIGYEALQPKYQKLADKNFELLKNNPDHPSLHFKKVGNYWSVRVGIDFRALAVQGDDGFVWFWIGPHSDYERMIR